MVRPLGEIVRRGVDNVFANWPLLLIRIAESVALIAMMVAIVLLAVVPLVAAGLGGSFAESLGRTADPRALLGSISIGLVLYAILVISFALGLAILVHSFVEGGIVGCYVAAERTAPEANAPRASFAVFTPELWWSEAKRNLWRFFWIYNAIWAGYSLLILIPLLPLAIFVILFPQSPVAIAVSLVGMLAILLFAIFLAFVVVLWNQVVLVDAARRDLGPLEAIAASREAMRGRILPIVLVGGIFFVLSGTAGGAVAGVSFTFDAAGAFPGLAAAFIPLQIVLSIVNSVVSALFGSWLVAALAAVLAGGRSEVRHDVAVSAT